MLLVNSKAGEIKFIFEEDVSFEGCTLITGWHGVGESGFIAVSHMVDALAARRVGYIVSQYIPPFVSIKDGRISLPFEVYMKDNIVLIVPIFEPYKYEYKAFAESIVDWASSCKISRCIMVGGLDNRLKHDHELKVVPTRAYLNEFGNHDCELLEEGLFITNMLALLLMFFDIRGFPAISILPYADRGRPDPIAAKVAVEAINKILGLSIDVDPLVDEAKSIESDIQDMLSATRATTNEVYDAKDMFT